MGSVSTFKPEDLSPQVWMGVVGAMLVLLRSIIDGTRRTALQLLAGCMFGAIGAMAAGYVWSSSHYVYLICGVAAVITENVVVGFFNMSQQFAANPRDLIAWFINTIIPAIPLFRAATAKNAVAAVASEVEQQATAAAVAPAPAAPVTPVPPAAGPVVQSGEPQG